MTLLHIIWKKVRSMGFTFILGFLLCIFQSSESILVKLAGNRSDPHPSSAKLLFLSELLKFTISYTLLCVERKQLVGTGIFYRRKCCRSASASCCRTPGHGIARDHLPVSQLDDEEYLPLSDSHIINDDDPEIDEITKVKNNPSKTFSLSCAFPPILFFAVPGAIYFFNNNLTFVLLSLMPAPTYVVLSNLKILTTGLFSFIFLNRVLTTPQWISLGILFLSTAVSQIDLEKGISLSISIQAFLLMILFCSLSAAASVFSEYVMKERFAKESIHLQNMKLYMFGILFNCITYMLTPSLILETATGVSPSFFSDIAPIHFMIVMAYASLGLVTSAIIKFSGSITKVYASSMSMFFAALVSWLLMNDQLTVLFFVGCFGCCLALHLYYRAPIVSSETESNDNESFDKEFEDEAHHDPTSSTSSESRQESGFCDLGSVKIEGGRNGYISLDTRR